MLTRSRSAKKENSSSAESPATIRAAAARKIQSEKRTGEDRAGIRRASNALHFEPAKRQKSDDESSPPKPASPMKSPLSSSNNVNTPTKAPANCKRSLTFGSEEKQLPSRLQFPPSPAKIPEAPKAAPKPAVTLAKNPTLPAYQNTSKSLNPSCAGDIIGREKEIKDIRDFLIEKMDARDSGSMYISGGPGTGKTACLTLVLKEVGLNDSIFINCISKPTPLSLLKEIASRLGVKTGLADVNELLRGIERRTSGRHDTVVVVLDEIDALASKFQENLYALFSMPAKSHSRLVLIGVANALDLTTRVLPHLKWLAPETRPVLIHFRPYSKFQLGQIISKRLGNEGSKILPPIVVQYVAGKVANLNGDCRRALDVCRVCVDRKMVSTRRQLVLQKEDKENGGKNEDVEAVSLPEVAKVFGEGVGMGLASTVGAKSGEGALPLLQKLALLALWAAMGKAKKEPIVSLAKLYEVFRKVCARTGSTSSVVSKSEFTSLCSLLESRGVVELRDGLGAPKTPAMFKSPRCTSIILRTSLAELERDLRADESNRIFALMLDNPSLIS